MKLTWACHARNGMQVNRVWEDDVFGSKLNLFKKCIYLVIYVKIHGEFLLFTFDFFVTFLDCHRPLVLLFQMVFVWLFEFIDVY